MNFESEFALLIGRNTISTPFQAAALRLFHLSNRIRRRKSCWARMWFFTVNKLRVAAWPNGLLRTRLRRRVGARQVRVLAAVRVGNVGQERQSITVVRHWNGMERKSRVENGHCVRERKWKEKRKRRNGLGRPRAGVRLQKGVLGRT
jgi:hypothetical protein